MEHQDERVPVEADRLRGDRGGAARIALAEDDADMRAMVADALRRDGHHVIELATGADLLVCIARLYRQRDPDAPLDLLVSDIRMPVVTGMEILRGIRDAHLVIPVILMTAFGDAATRREAESLDAVLLEKPLSLSDLRGEVRRLLAA
jgi:two-component system cell cycle response regulator CpdR